MITCIVAIFNMSVTFSPSKLPVVIEKEYSKFVYAGSDSVDTYWEVSDKDGRKVTFYPSCKGE
jgi:hypothetical protein